MGSAKWPPLETRLIFQGLIFHFHTPMIMGGKVKLLNNPQFSKTNRTVGVFRVSHQFANIDLVVWKLTTTLIFINKSNAEEPKKCVATDFAVILGYGVYSKMSFLYTYFIHEQRLSST